METNKLISLDEDDLFRVEQIVFEHDKEGENCLYQISY